MKVYKFSNEQIGKISDMSKDCGNIMLASVVLPAILGTQEITLMMVGFTLTLFFWIISLTLSR